MCWQSIAESCQLMIVWKKLAGTGVDFYLHYGVPRMVELLFKPSMYGGDPWGVIID